MVAQRQLRRVLVGLAVAALAMPGGGSLLRPTPTLAIAPAAPDVTASGPNVFQKAKNDPIYYRPMAGRSAGSLLRTYGLAPSSEYRMPTDVVVVGSYVYVLDAGNYRILKRRASDLGFVKASPSIAARVIMPHGIASDGTYLYITDQAGSRIVVFRLSTFAYVGSYGSFGDTNGHFNQPTGIAVAGGHVYVSDTVNDRVVKLSTWPIKWQAATVNGGGSGKAQFHYPVGLAVIGSYLYVADSGNARIARMSTGFSTTGWKAIGSYGSPAIAVNGPDDLATDGTSLYAHMSVTSDLVKLTSSLGFVKHLAAPTGSKAWAPILGLGASTAGLFTTQYTYENVGPGYNNQVTKNSLSTLAVAKVSGSKTPVSPNQWSNPQGATSDGTNYYIGDGNRIHVCPIGGSACTRDIVLPSSFFVYALATDGSSLFGVDYLNNTAFRVNIVTGAVTYQYGTLGTGNDQLNAPSGIVYLPSLNELFILDSGNNRVVVRKWADFSYVTEAGTHGSGSGQLTYPMGMATDGVFLYIADSGNNRITKWLAGSLGTVVATAGSQGSGDGQFSSPRGIATDGDSVWVADTNNNRVERLNAGDLSYEAQITTSSAIPFPGAGPTQLSVSGGRLLMVDYRRARAYMTWGGGPLAVTATTADGLAAWSIIEGWAGGTAPSGWTKSGDAVYAFVSAATRYLGWSSTAVGGTLRAVVTSFSDGAGTPRDVQLIADSTAPTISPIVAAPPEQFSTTSTTSFAHSLVLWTVQDLGAGVASTELQRSVNGGTWTTVSKQSQPNGPDQWTFGLDTTLKTGTTYRFRARGTDTVGNVSAWKTGASFTVAMIQENGTGVTASSGWSRVADSQALGGYVRVASAAGKTLTFSGTLSAVAPYIRLGPGGGHVKIYVDGVLLTTVNTANGSTVERVGAYFERVAKGTHIIKLVTVGDGPVAVDAFVIEK